MKKYTFLLLLVGQGYLGAMEKVLEHPKTPLEKSAVLEKIVVCDQNHPLYQIESVSQKESRCGYFSLCNCLRIMSYLDAHRTSEDIPLDKGKGWDEYAPTHGFNWNTDFLDDQSHAWQYVLNKGMITLGNEKLPASVRDIMQGYMKKKLAELSTLETDASKERDRGIMCYILEITLASINPRIELVHKGTLEECIIWSVDKNEFIKQFRIKALAVQQALPGSGNSEEHVYRVGVIARKVSSEWINQIFDEGFKTEFHFFRRYKGDKIGGRVNQRLNCGGWLADNQLVSLIGKFGFKDASMSIKLLGGRRTFEQYYTYKKGCEEKEANSTGSLQSIIDQYKYEIGYAHLSALKQKMQNPNADIIEGFIVRLGDPKKTEESLLGRLWRGRKTEEKNLENTTDQAHWISLVVSRLNGVVRYYVADSWGNKSQIKNLLIHDIISFLKDEPQRKESLFYINPFCLKAASRKKLDEKGNKVLDKDGNEVPLTLKEYMAENKLRLHGRSSSLDEGMNTLGAASSISSSKFSAKSMPHLFVNKPSNDKEGFNNKSLNVVKSETKEGALVLPEEDHPQEEASIGLTKNQLLIGSALVGSAIVTLYMLKQAQKHPASKDAVASPALKVEGKKKVHEEKDGDDEASLLMTESSALGILSPV